MLHNTMVIQNKTAGVKNVKNRNPVTSMFCQSHFLNTTMDTAVLKYSTGMTVLTVIR